MKEKIRKPYKIPSKTVKVNNSCIITSGNCQHSVSTNYLGKTLTTQIRDGYLYICDNTNLVAVYSLEHTQKLNYKPEHYKAIAKLSGVFDKNDIHKIAKKNLEILGRFYND